jgi:hypothetical protein
MGKVKRSAYHACHAQVLEVAKPPDSPERNTYNPLRRFPKQTRGSCSFQALGIESDSPSFRKHRAARGLYGAPLSASDS